MEQSIPDAGLTTTSITNMIQLMQSRQFGKPGHNFIDQNGDGICDHAQNGSPTWHGPGFIDANQNGICDYWEEGGRGHGYGMRGGHNSYALFL